MGKTGKVLRAFQWRVSNYQPIRILWGPFVARG